MTTFGTPFERFSKMKGTGQSVPARARKHCFCWSTASYRPSLILLDLMMPGMDGWQVLSRIDEQADLHSIPVALMSAHPSVRKAFEKSKASDESRRMLFPSQSTFCGFCRSSNRFAVGPIHRSEFLQESARRDDGRTTCENP